MIINWGERRREKDKLNKSFSLSPGLGWDITLLEVVMNSMIILFVIVIMTICSFTLIKVSFNVLIKRIKALENRVGHIEEDIIMKAIEEN